MNMCVLTEAAIFAPDGKLIAAVTLRDTWTGIGQKMVGATHVFVAVDTTSPGGVGCLMPSGPMTIEAFMEQARHLE